MNNSNSLGPIQPLPNIVTRYLSSPGEYEYASAYNLSESFFAEDDTGRILRARALNVPGGARTHGKSLHKLQSLVGPKWYEVQKHPHVAKAGFAILQGEFDPITCAPLVVMISPNWNSGNILKVIQDSTPTPKQRCIWLSQICDAVEHLHASGLTHGNIHPRNILIRDDGNACLTDACLYDLTLEHLLPDDCPGIGTNAHMTITCKTAHSVEEYDGRIPASYDQDVFGLAASIWMGFSGKEPWIQRSRAIKVMTGGHKDLTQPDGMSNELWMLLQTTFAQRAGSVPTVRAMKTALQC